ncbi:MAG: choice-of-anchor D domain-containing protein [Myxococcaceae bacterium]|nr:choice-of-anchor D domain-containing protein [Myxococcaceae bacterium]
MFRVSRALLFASALAGAFAACGPDQTSQVQPQLVPPPDTADFGPVPVLNEKHLGIDVLNVGRASLKVFSVTLREDNVPFEIVSHPDELGASESAPIDVVFRPPAEQDYSATLTLATDDPESPLVDVHLVGKGSTRAVMEVEPDAIDFGRVAEGDAAVQAITVRSTGTADLILEEIAFAEGSSPAFQFLGSVTTPATVPHRKENGLPGEIKVTVRYTVEPGAPDVNNAVVRIRGTDPDQREKTVAITGTVNRAPIPVIADLGVGAPGMEVTLDGSASTDPDGDVPLSYHWVLRSKPLGAMTTIAGPEQPVTTMTLDPKLPGEYVVELEVTDAAGATSLTPARASIVAAPAEKLLVEMFWDNTVTDIDLHLLEDPSVTFGTIPGDCFYQNPNPDWGVQGDPTDDPTLIRDALTGYGPEVIGYVNPPENKTYRVFAEFAHDHGAANPASAVTVRIYEYGKVQYEKTFTLNEKGEVFGVADIDWPSGKIKPLQ